MSEFLKSIPSAVNIGGVGAAIAFAFSVYQFVAIRRRESRQREFENYHELIERLVAPDTKGNLPLDRQVAIVFELRHFPRYYECSYRILTGLKDNWKNHPNTQPRLMNEIDLTLALIKKPRGFLGLRRRG